MKLKIEIEVENIIDAPALIAKAIINLPYPPIRGSIIQGIGDGIGTIEVITRDSIKPIIKEPSYQDILEGIKELKKHAIKGSEIQVPYIILKKSFVESNLNPGNGEIVEESLKVNRIYGSPALVIEDEDFEKIFDSTETYAYSTLSKEDFERISLIAKHYKIQRGEE